VWRPALSLLSPRGRIARRRSTAPQSAFLHAYAKIREYQVQIARQAQQEMASMWRQRGVRSPEGLFPPGRNQDGEIESFAARRSKYSGFPWLPALFLQGCVNFHVSTIGDVAWSHPGESSDSLNLFFPRRELRSSGCLKKEVYIKPSCPQPSTLKTRNPWW